MMSIISTRSEHINYPSEHIILGLSYKQKKLFLSLFKPSSDNTSIFESRISKNNLPTINVNVPGYNMIPVNLR